MAKDKYTDIVRGFCELMPSVPTRTLARIILEDHPKCCSGDIEKVRGRLRGLRGALGAASRGRKNVVASSIDGFIPPPMHSKREPYVLTQTGSILHIGDIHVPFHDPEAIRLMMQYVTDNYDIKAVCINGDFWDCLSVSKFSKEARPHTMTEEKEYAEDIIDTLEEAFPKAKMIWKLGNHETRLARYLYTNAPDMHKLIVDSIGDIFGVKARGWDVVGALQLIQAGKLWVVHGGEVGLNSPGANAAKSLYNKTKSTALCFHLHQPSSHIEKTLDGRFPQCWSAGCLCDLQPDYCPHNNRHMHGFAIQELEKDGNFCLDNMKILHGRVLRA
jgi:hypothetical protein